MSNVRRQTQELCQSPTSGSASLQALLRVFFVTLAAKVALRFWLRTAIGLGAAAVIALLSASLVFAGITVAKQFNSYREKSALDDKITTYLKGHYPDELQRGYRVEVGSIGERPLLVFMYPDGSAAGSPHPLDTYAVRQEIQKLAQDNGYPGPTVWGFQLPAMSEREVSDLLRRR